MEFELLYTLYRNRKVESIMALIKEKDTTFGVKASYWKIGLMVVNTMEKEVSFTLKLLVNKAATSPIDEYVVADLMGLEDKTLYNKYFAEDKGKTYKDWQTACYMYAKAHVKFFKDAVDDPDEIELLRD